VVVFASSCTRAAQLWLKAREEHEFSRSRSSRPCPAEEIWLLSSSQGTERRSSWFAKNSVCLALPLGLWLALFMIQILFVPLQTYLCKARLLPKFQSRLSVDSFGNFPIPAQPEPQSPLL
jgi:hypothetical protein